MNKRSIGAVDVAGKRVLMRVDFNVPIDKSGIVLDDSRIKAALPTIEYLLDHGASVVLMSHLGRPKGRTPALSLASVARRLGQLLGRDVPLLPDCVGSEVEQAVAALNPGNVVLLENLRFHAEEEQNDPHFSQQLARLGDLYVDDAFGTAHRAHASTVGVTAFLPAVAGLLLDKEVSYLSRVLESPEHPFAAVVGGAKVSTKAQVLQQLVRRVDVLVLGGAMASTFLKAQGYGVGDSLVEDDKVEDARQLMARAQDRRVQIVLPVDVVVADAFTPDARHKVVTVDGISSGWRIMDLGPRTIKAVRAALAPCKTILWNGPVGVAEFPAFSKGTRAVAEALAVNETATTVVGGGETAAAVVDAGVSDRMSHVSTGGGATLEFIEGKTLPGVAALLDA